MKTLNLLLIKLGKRAWFQVLIVLELTAALTLFMMVIGKVEYYAQPKKALDPAKLKNCLMYSHMDETWLFSTDNVLVNKMQKVLNACPEVLRYGTTYSSNTGFKIADVKGKLEEVIPTNLWEDDYVYLFTTTYDEAVAKNLRLPLSSGKQLTEADTPEDVIPAVFQYEFSDALQFGDVYEVKYLWFPSGEEEVTYGEDGMIDSTKTYAEEMTIRIQVCGFLQKENYFFDLSSASGAVPTTFLFRNDYPGNMILLRTPDNPLGPLSIRTQFSGQMIEMKPGAEKAMERIMVDLADQGTVQTFDQLVENTQKVFISEARQPFLAFLICLAITIASVAGLNVLLGLSQKREYGVFYICGSTWRKCVWLDVLRSAILLAVPIVMASLIVQKTIELDEFVLLTPAVYIISVFLVVGIYLVSTLGFQLKMLKTKPVDCIREAE
ncbi:MAG: hypothetical protein ACLSAP_00570 [Oscillospiraceae bacterium]